MLAVTGLALDGVHAHLGSAREERAQPLDFPVVVSMVFSRLPSGYCGYRHSIFCVNDELKK